jgi:hypothetical protein
MEWIIAPTDGVGPIRFGMTRDTVRALIPGGFSEHPSGDQDFFTKLFVRVSYNHDCHCTAVTLLPRHQPTLCNQEILALSYREAQSLLSSLDSDLWADDDRTVSKTLGIYVWSLMGLTNQTPEGLVVFTPSTWEAWYPSSID